MDYVTLAVIAVIAIFLLGWKLKWVFRKIIIICACVVVVLVGIWFLTDGIMLTGDFLNEHVWGWFSKLFE